jgi:hypothetical protein
LFIAVFDKSILDTSGKYHMTISLIIPILACALIAGQTGSPAANADTVKDTTHVTTGKAVQHDTAAYYFYSPLPYGTQGKYNPGDFFINGGFGVWQFSGNRKVFDVPYTAAWRNTWGSMRHPMWAIENFGVKEWFTSEIVPTSFELKHGQFFPNYFLHVLGAGMQSRKMEEWYRYHNVPCPRLWSIVTMLSEHVFEEMIEDGGTRGINEDPVSDLYIFNPAGILLFMNNGVCRFFSDKLSLNEWSLQPSINVRNGQLENMGQFYVAKLPLERTHTWSAIAYFGMQELFGIARKIKDDQSIALTGGVIVNNLYAANISSSQNAYTANLKWSAGAFYDKKNSLLASLVVSGADHNRFRLNVYPGLFKVRSFTPGIFIDNTGYWTVGISIRYIPIGVSTGSMPD